MDILKTLLYYTVKMSTPLFFVVIGGVFVQRAGVFNFALESAVNIGALCGVLFTVLSGGNVVYGILGAILMCTAVNGIFGLFVVHMDAHPTVVGMSINTFTSAIAPFVLGLVFGTRGTLMATQWIDPATIYVDIPILRSIPILSDIFNRQTPLTYISWIVLIVLTVIYYKTKFGTYIRVTGENQDAALALGMKVKRLKMIALFISGVCCALAGLNLSVESLGMFTLEMAAGRGFICLSAINCGKREPVKSAVYALLFGFAKAVQVVAGAYIPSSYGSLIQTIPYVTILIVLVATEMPRVRKSPMRIFQD